MSEHADILAEAGWYEGRSVEHQPALARLTSNAHLMADWFPSVVAEFDGLVLEFERNGRNDQVVLAPAKAGQR